jgi:hypothetical protein
MVRSGERPDVSMIASASCDLTGILGLGCGNCQ